jgi:transposase InsO family protein
VVSPATPCQAVRSGVPRQPYEAPASRYEETKLQPQFCPITQADLLPELAQKAETIAAAFLTNWISHFGVPRLMVTDNDPPPVSEIMTELANQLGIQKLRTSPYHPQGNAPVEAFHKTINQRLYSLDKGAPSSVPFQIALQLVLWSYRAVIQTTMEI